MKSGYESAATFPIKLVKNHDWLKNGNIIPYHLQVNPTNKCNKSCDYCSYKLVDKSLELDYPWLLQQISLFSKNGGGALTITGGGEPTMYPMLSELIVEASRLGLQVGLVTNGLLLPNIKDLNLLSWCRISLNGSLPQKLLNTIKKVDTDWSLSYVYTKPSDFDKVNEILRDSVIGYISHIRITNNIFCPCEIPRFENDRKIIYQDKTKYYHGVSRCGISNLKPYLNADGFYYPCCGVQYARLSSPGILSEDMRIGNDILGLTQFDGTRCDRCYYWEYNDLINKMLTKTEHERFL